MKPTLTDKNILIMGLGRSGLAVARFAADRGARVTVTDASPTPAPAATLADLRHRKVALALGGHPEEIFDRADLVVLSPGVPHTLPALQRARDRGVAVVGEMELAARFVDAPVVAVTGTNGKTTTTELLAAMLRASGQRIFVGGNIGCPLMEYAHRPEPVDAVVVEVSSFQLDTMERFHPRIAVLLNVTEDHLDRYTDMAAYAASKARIFMNQTPADTAVFNGQDPQIGGLVRSVPARPLPFYSGQRKKAAAKRFGAWIGSEGIRIDDGQGRKGEISLARTPLQGGHNRENIAAAALAALAAGATLAGVQQAVDRFAGLSHRLETVAVIDRVTYVDDSKATNVDAVVRALMAFSAPVVLILGGRDKGGDYGVLAPAVERKVRRLILMGEAAERILQRLGGKAPTCRVADMAEAVKEARAAARPGDVVLLSPACASFDMYDSYAQRGDDFRARVQEKP